jgi:hypothetical protein
MDSSASSPLPSLSSGSVSDILIYSSSSPNILFLRDTASD